jgi:hypothetical protein
MSDLLDFIPPAIRPVTLQLPAAVGDVLTGMRRMRAVSSPSARHKLLRRVDSKFAVSRTALPALLESVADDYEVLTAAGEYAARYVTVYFDTEDRSFLRDHLRGRRPRHKLRIRHYIDREVASLEVKSKTAANATDKKQRDHAFGNNVLDVDDRHWAATITGCQEPIRARAWTSCHRITLLRLSTAGRLTLDLNVSVGTKDSAHTLNDLVLVEVKRERADGNMLLWQALRAVKAQPVGLSKYVAAMMSAQPVLPRSRFVAVLGRYARPEYWKECMA